jgi:hypothetical protein
VAQKGVNFILYMGWPRPARGERITIQAGTLPIKEGCPLYEGIEIGRIDPILLTEQGRSVTASSTPSRRSG